MKLDTQEKIRMAEMTLFLGGALASNLIDQENSVGQLVCGLSITPYYLDIISSFRTQRITDEYKELKKLDKEIVSNTAYIIDYIGNNNPIGIFASYIYLYRQGYLSYNKNFVYDNDMKDFAGLLSVDVYRGKGVCRSVASLLTSLYKEFGYNARTLVVNANKESIRNNLHLSNVSLQKSDKGNAFAGKIAKLTNFIPTPNHAITLVDDGKNSYKLDPTNDCMMLNGKLNKLVSPCSDKGIMRNYMIMDLFYSALGFFENDVNISKYAKQYNMPNISVDDYKELYLQALEICNQNKDAFNYFYEDNMPLYESVEEISKDQRDYLKRLFSLIPGGKKKGV